MKKDSKYKQGSYKLEDDICSLQTDSNQSFQNYAFNQQASRIKKKHERHSMLLPSPWKRNSNIYKDKQWQRQSMYLRMDQDNQKQQSQLLNQSSKKYNQYAKNFKQTIKKSNKKTQQTFIQKNFKQQSIKQNQSKQLLTQSQTQQYFSFRKRVNFIDQNQNINKIPNINIKDDTKLNGNKAHPNNKFQDIRRLKLSYNKHLLKIRKQLMYKNYPQNIMKKVYTPKETMSRISLDNKLTNKAHKQNLNNNQQTYSINENWMNVVSNIQNYNKVQWTSKQQKAIVKCLKWISLRVRNIFNKNQQNKFNQNSINHLGQGYQSQSQSQKQRKRNCQHNKSQQQTLQIKCMLRYRSIVQILQKLNQILFSAKQHDYDIFQYNQTYLHSTEQVKIFQTYVVEYFIKLTIVLTNQYRNASKQNKQFIKEVFLQNRKVDNNLQIYNQYTENHFLSVNNNDGQYNNKEQDINKISNHINIVLLMTDKTNIRISSQSDKAKLMRSKQRKQKQKYYISIQEYQYKSTNHRQNIHSINKYPYTSDSGYPYNSSNSGYHRNSINSGYPNILLQNYQSQNLNIENLFNNKEKDKERNQQFQERSQFFQQRSQLFQERNQQFQI